MSLLRYVLVLVTTLFSAGCVYTVPGEKLPPIAPPPAEFQPQVEQTVGDFSFTLEGGKMVTSNYMGRQVNKQLLQVWRQESYIAGETYVESSQFTGNADYDLTLSGTQYGESSILAQILSGLTLMILPYTVDTKFDIQYTVQDRKTGQAYGAGVEDSYKSYVQLFLLLALPWGQNGAQETYERMAKHLYTQLREQGAFRKVLEPAATAGGTDSPPADLGEPDTPLPVP